VELTSASMAFLCNRDRLLLSVLAGDLLLLPPLLSSVWDILE